ncbi:hypothetical protein A374_13545 [Fictibacillus macauensis ZFHKF-1]|uniref:Spore germination protein gerPA/gerPF n=1 Tax=Fictibacillus macauensis ZFHKF-1 TaxID=1196324 RepID=I8AH13_9BACL|nr:spore germination protein [Fictibacillus macauensis]EIT84719.1 hypothetical protein A374_13545 [Fictibacillus macauensis ZFHKF-1]
MQFSFNIKNVVTNGITQNGNIDIGSSLQNSHTANTKSVGAVFTFGDCSDACAYMINLNEDNDENDMTDYE